MELQRDLRTAFLLNKKYFFSFPILFFLMLNQTPTAQSAHTVPVNENYFKLDIEGDEYIFPQELSSYISILNQRINFLKANYQNSFSWKLDEKTSFIFASKNNQIANAFSTVSPNNINTFYPGGITLIDQFAITSWIDTLLMHEVAHLYQINAKQGPSQWAKSIFGNPFFIFPLIPLPIFLTPNSLLPLWLTEGNAVLNESQFGFGGRLYSGEERALFYSLINSKKLNHKRLINNHLNFPFNHEKYILGAYFNLFLAQKYGLNKVNGFFYNHSTHYINPLRINSSFKRYFGIDYDEAVFQFIQEYQNLAKDQKFSKGEEISFSLVYSPLNSFNGKVAFLTNDYLKGPNQLNIYDFKKNNLFKEPTDLAIGKIFQIEDKFFSAAAQTLNRQELIYGLWGENKTFNSKFYSKFVLDIKQDKVLYFDTSTSFLSPKLFINSEFINSPHSLALLDKNFNVYYFIQEKNKRILYKNQRPLFEYVGHYGKVADIDDDGNVFFIGATPFGSSLFSYSAGQNQIKRIFDSDTIIDAKKLENERFLIVETNSNGYSYKISKQDKPQNTTPTNYFYPFNQNSSFEKYPPDKEIKLTSLKEDQLTSTSVSPSPYTLSNGLRFNFWNIQTLLGSKDKETVIEGSFSDPLEFHQIRLRADLSSGPRNRYELKYSNSQYLINWDLLYQFNESKISSSLNRQSNNYHKIEAILGYPFFNSGFYNGHFYQGISFARYDDFRSDFTPYTGVLLKKERTYNLSFFPYRLFTTGIEYAQEREGGEGNIFHHSMFDLGNEKIIGVEAVLGWSKSEYFYPGKTIKNYSLIVPQSSFGPFKEEEIWGGKFGTIFHKVINQGIYFSTFPVSLRRFAPGVFGNIIFHNQQGPFSEKNHKELGLGFKGELLLAHLFPINVSLNLIRSLDSNGNLEANLNLGGNF